MYLHIYNTIRYVNNSDTFGSHTNKKFYIWQTTMTKNSFYSSWFRKSGASSQQKVHSPSASTITAHYHSLIFHIYH